MFLSGIFAALSAVTRRGKAIAEAPENITEALKARRKQSSVRSASFDPKDKDDKPVTMPWIDPSPYSVFDSEPNGARINIDEVGQSDFKGFGGGDFGGGGASGSWDDLSSSPSDSGGGGSD